MMEKKIGLSALALKWIAVITMLTDHLGIALLGTAPDAVCGGMRIAGRLAFPIYCFLLVEGFYHTSDIKKYLIRLGVFALVSEIPFDLLLFGRLFYTDYQNVFFTLFIGLMLLYLYSRFLANVQPIYAIMAFVSMLCLAFVIRSDYGAEGVLIIFLFYFFRTRPVPMVISIGIVLFLMGGIEPFAMLAFLPIAVYNGERGGRIPDSPAKRIWQKYFFYCFYPVHLVLLWAVEYFLLS